MDITTDDENNIYITGSFSSSVINFDTVLLNNSNSTEYEIFVTKLDSSGNVIWAKSYGGMGDDLSNSIAIDNNGNVLIAGSFKSDIIRFNNLTILNTDPNNNYYDFFVAKISSAGDVIWVNKSQYGNQNDFGWAIATDKEGNAYATGSFNSDSLVFGNYTLNNYGNHDAFLCKYDSLGNVCWVKSQKGMNSETGYSVAVDTSGNIYVTGGYTYSPGSSAPLIIKNLSFPIPFVAGAIEPSYIAKYNTNGILLHAETLACGGEDIIAVTTNSSGDIYIGGDYYYTVNKFIIGDDTLHKIPGVYEVIFIAKYNCRNLPNVINERDLENTISLYPNPATTQITITGYTPAYVTLCNTLGQTVAEASNTNTLWLGNLPQGLYLLQLFDAKGALVKTEKVVKE
jgi:hypothetical protein